MAKPIIGILGSDFRTEDEKFAFGTIETYKNAIIDLGGIPITLMTTQSVDVSGMLVSDVPKLTHDNYNDMIRQVSLCDGILLPGGKRIYPYDMDITRYCLEINKPILGICLGMQNMASVDTSRNVRDITEDIPNDEYSDNYIPHGDISQKYVHTINIKKNTLLYSIIEKEEIEVNSRHIHRVKDQLDDAIVTATAPDGTIEAIEFPNKRFAVGVQFHPEALYKEDENMKNILKSFIYASAINNI